MPWIDKANIDKAKEYDALPWLLSNMPNELIRKSSKHYVSREHDSLKLDSSGRWCWWSKNIGGRSAVDYLVKVKGYSFTDAVITVLTGAGEYSAEQEVSPAEKKYSFKMPDKATDNEALYKYLLGRNIEKKIIDDFIEEGLIYQEAKHNNIVFVGTDYEGIPGHASLRGTCGRYHGAVPGSNREYTFRHLTDNPLGNCIHLFEAPIDMLSYCTLLYDLGIDYKSYDLMSVCGLKPKGNEPKLPVALSVYLSKYPDRIAVIHFDNDEVGINGANDILSLMEAGHAYNAPAPSGKDINDYMMIHGRLKRRKQCE